MDIDDFKRELSDLLDRAKACGLCPIEVSLALEEQRDDIDSNTTISLTPVTFQ